MSTNKVLKLAKAAIDKKDYEAALKHCQDVFIRDASNYNGNVFAGLACLQLSRHDDARRHYSTAIETQPDNPLAWKGLANYYDKHRPVVQQEQLDALNTYSKLLSFVESDATKTSSILFKMAVLHEVLSQHSEVLSCYGRILATTEEGAELPTEKVATMISHFLSQKDISLAIWGMLVKAFDLFEGDTKSGVRSKFVSRGMAVYKASISLDGGLHAKLVSECEELLSCQPQHALLSLVQLTLWEQAPAMQVQYPCDVSLELTSNQKGWCEQLGVLMEEGTLDATGLGVACAGDALVKITDGKWIDAKTVIENSLTSCPAMCELHLLSVIVHLRLHDYHTAELEGQKGLKCASSFPKCLITSVQNKLKLCLLCVAMESEDGPQSKTLANECSELMSGDLHVTALVTRGYILAGELPQAREVLHTLQGQESAKHLVCALQGEIFLSMKDWDNAIKQLAAAIEQCPNSSTIHFLHGTAIWRSEVTDKRPAYASFIKAAKLDPCNGEVFFYLGRYQNLVNKNTERAIKCFQKAVALMPSLTMAAMELGDLLTTSGEEQKAFEVYNKICADSPPDKARHAWLRTGLYHHSKGIYNEAIKCFQTYGRVDSSNVQCWECLGDAYLSRGSYNSALNAFNKCLELEPSSLYSLYRLAGIKQLLGKLREAVTEYTAVLELDSHYVPALKGRGETHLTLARQALADNLDSNAVDHVSLALRDLTNAARHRPQFVCLWKLIGDSCFCVHAIPNNVARLSIPIVLQGHISSYVADCVVVDKLELLQVGIRAYAQALHLSSDSAYCWHDLALAYYHISQETGEETEKQTNLATALSAAKKALSLAPNNFLYWNSLGLIAASEGVEDIGLAQHCFIMSLQESNNAMAWTNLGALYFKKGNVKLAHEALMNAQSADPDQMEAWVGQALVAESIGSSEAMDLFRHSTQLGYHPEGTLGYGYWVCNTLNTIDSGPILTAGKRSFNATATTAILQARDTLEKYVRRERSNVCALNYLGLLFELEGLTKSAEKMFRRALEGGAVENELVALRTNLARVVSANGGEAVSEYLDLPQRDPLLRLQLALALCRAGKWAESFKVYESLVSEEGGVVSDERSAVLTAQAMVAFASGDRATCKKQLFKSFQCSPVCVHGLVAMCVLGCLDNELTLLLAALQEIVKVLDSGVDAHLHSSCISALEAIALLLKDDPQAIESVDVINTVTSILTGNMTYTLPPSPLTLHTGFANLTSPKQGLNMLQILLHSYPTDKWCLPHLIGYIQQVS